MHIESVAMLFFGVREQHQNEWHNLNWSEEDGEIPCQTLAEKLGVTWQEFTEDGKRYRCIATFCEAAHSSKGIKFDVLPTFQDKWPERIQQYAEAIGAQLSGDLATWHLVTWVIE